MSGFLSGISSDVAAVGGAVSAASGLIGALTGHGQSLWLLSLQPASWRGVPFAVESSRYTGGRRVAVHEYPYRDSVWPEDMGRAPRSVSFSGFVCGDDCYAQAQALIRASETQGSGTLVHPSLGALTVALVRPLECTERMDRGRVVEIAFEFVLAGLPIFPDSDDNTTDQVDDDADDADDASSSDFLSSIGNALQTGAQAVQGAISSAGQITAAVGMAAGDASLIVGAVRGLTGNFGPFAAGARGTLLTGISSVQGAIGAVNQAQAQVGNLAASVNNLAAGL